MSIAPLLRNEKPRSLTPEEEKLKRDLYEKIPPRRRKFIDRIGYDNWDPFPEPNEPVEIRKDVTQRTAQQLMQEFIRSKKCEAQLAGHVAGNFRVGNDAHILGETVLAMLPWIGYPRSLNALACVNAVLKD